MEGDDTPVKRRRTSLVSFTSFGNRSYSDAHISPTTKRASSHPPVSDDKPDLPHTPKRASTHDGIRSPTRASFMSPTRASLARFNPHLLPPSTSSDRKPPLPGGSRIQRNSKDSRPELNSGETPDNGSFTPATLQEKSGTDGRNPTAEADRTAPEPKTWAKTDGLSNTIPRRRSQTPQFIAPRMAQSQASPASEVGASLPKVREENQQGSPTALRVQLNAEPQNGTSTDRISNEDLMETEDLYEHQSGALQKHPKRLFDSFSEVAKSIPASISKELGHEPAPELPDGLLFSSPSIMPWGTKQPDLNSSPPVSGAPSLKPRTGLGPRKLITKTSQFEAVQLGDSATSCSATGFSRNDSSLAQRLALFLPFSKPPKKPGTVNSRPEPVHGEIPIKVTVTEGTSPSPISENSTSREQYTLPQSPQEPLIVKFHLSIDRKTQKYTKLDISSISPWANVELGKWLQTEAVDLDRPTIEETISRYWELSKVRATCWHRCEHHLKHDPAGSHNENPSPLANGPSNPPQSSLSSFQPYLGQQSLCLTQFPGIVLLIDWRVAISPDGSVQSILSGRAGFPDSWTEKTGGAAALGKIGEAFDLLVQEFGVFEAVRTLWGVIFGSNVH
ncbi:hypothetical protein MMC31_007635 [Peltigera leucophlebia]|nr:hypothetical protein [Peltigera leucophlebia]